jgi:hypothetical protein
MLFGCPGKSTPVLFIFTRLDNRDRELGAFLIDSLPSKACAKRVLLKENATWAFRFPGKPKPKGLRPAHFEWLGQEGLAVGAKEGTVCHKSEGDRRGACVRTGLAPAPACELSPHGQIYRARIYFDGRARRALAQPSLVTWCERATARESEGTSWVMQEPAPM